MFAARTDGPEIVLGRGAWCKRVDKRDASNDAQRRWDPRARLSRNIGDRVMICHGEIGATLVEIVGIRDDSHGERWRVTRIAGDTPCAPGAVWLMGAPKARTR